ncbi:alpha/beta hydrolase [Aurantivibrio plasticivorans]
MAVSDAQEISFDLGGITIAAKEWGQPGDLPVLALHGWLDNCASFNKLAPMLKGVHFIAIDMAGHGLSGHRQVGMSYPIVQDVTEVFQIADQLHWQEFALMGHSRGAIISALAAGTFPERISHLALIDGFKPSTTKMEDSPTQLAQSIIDLQRHRSRGFAVYPDIETAVVVRQRGQIPLSYEAAKQLVEHGLREVEGGYTWSNDPQLKGASCVRLSEEAAHAFYQRITAKTRLIIAENGMPMLRDRLEGIAEQYPFIEATHIPGSHHLHMEDAAPAVADCFNQLFSQ